MIFLIYLAVMILLGIVLWATLLGRRAVKEGTRVAAEMIDDANDPPVGKQARKKPAGKSSAKTPGN